MQSTRIDLSIPRPTLVLALAFLGFAIQAPQPAYASYSTQGTLSMNTEGGPLIDRNIASAAQADISDSDTSVGGAGGGYSASLTNATISASTSAVNGLFAPGDYWSATATMTTASHDDLRFTVPAGTYPAGVYVVARLHVEGSVAASAGATAQHIYNFSFGGDSVLVTTNAPASSVSTDIDLTEELVAPGGTLNNPSTQPVRFTANIESRASAPGEVAQSASSGISGQVNCLVIPDGVTWTSDSGVFGAPICTSPAIPSLDGWGLAALAVLLGGAALWFAQSRRPGMA